jgi:hypothetical protein
MKLLQLVGLIAGAAIFVSCESTKTGGMGNQERKRLAALQEAQSQPQPDESDRNLWNAQVDRLNRGTNPAIRY